MADLYANENFPLPAVIHLRALGHNVLTSQESGRANQRVSDEQVLRFATSQNRAVVTLNRSEGSIATTKPMQALWFAPPMPTFKHLPLALS